MNDEISALATKLLERALQKNTMVATAESCTGGLIAGAITDIPGSSAILDRGFVTYTNEAKQEMLQVPSFHFAPEGVGAVSEETARAMAEGALKASRAALTVAVTGVAGPGGGSPEKPVGLVYFATALHGSQTKAEHHVFDGDRAAVRRATVVKALELLLDRL